MTKGTTFPRDLSIRLMFALPVMIFVVMAFSMHDPRPYVAGKPILAPDISLILPLDKGDISKVGDGYGNRLHPVLGKVRLHTGIDFFASEGTPVLSSEGGVVIKAEMAEAWGNLVVVKHNETFSTAYSHLQSMNVKEGDKITKGQLLGSVGHTGSALKDHLHFELHKNSVAIDPVTFLPALE